MVDAILAARNLTSDGSLLISRGSHGTHLAVFDDKSDGILIKNDYSGDLPAYAVAYVKDIDITTFGATRPVVVVDRVGTAFKRDYLVNSSAIIPTGKIGFAQKGPVVIVAYTTAGPVIGEGFGPVQSSFLCEKGQPCFLTCHGIVDSTNKWMLARTGEINTLLLKVTTTMAAGTAGAGTPATITTGYDIVVGGPPSTTSSGFSGTRPTLYNYGAAITATKWAAATWLNSQWIVTPLEC